MAHPKTRKFFRYLIPIILVLMVIPILFQRTSWESVFVAPEHPQEIRCAIAIKAQDDTCKALLTGFCYDVLKSYSKSSGIPVNVVLEKYGENYTDSLRKGVVDMIVLPWMLADTLSDVVSSDVMDNHVKFVCVEEHGGIARQFNHWLSDYVETGDYSSARKRFYTTGSPFKRAASDTPSNVAGPYDALLKKAGESMGWDWRLLAAVIWQESKFRIDVVSRRGAMGLMQMMPHTARKMGCRNIVDPEECISTGAKYLLRLEGLFRDYAADHAELQKMVLAAYNAGEGRLRDCITFASSQGVDYTRWDNLARVIPEMTSEAVSEVDSVRLGRFKGLETIAYVDAVEDLYSAFCKICPADGPMPASFILRKETAHIDSDED